MEAKFVLMHLFILTVGPSRTTTTTTTSAPLVVQDNSVCRSRGIILSSQEFQAETCAYCYMYMPSSQFEPGAKWVLARRLHIGQGSRLTDGNVTVVANVSDKNSPLLRTFAIGSSAPQLWRDCCYAAERCCDRMMANNMDDDGTLNSQQRCPPTWDGWQCWDDGGQPGQVEYRACPSYIYFHSSSAVGSDNTCGKYAEKTCMSDGRWFYRNNVGEWTNYTTCSRVSTYIVKEHVHVALYALSVVALTPAIIIFFSYKVLRVPRIAIHKNLFASLLLHCLSMITFKSVVLLPYIEQTAKQSNHSSLLEENTFECRLLLMLTKYFRLTNYTWMFCEGYYLHRLLANTFEEERSLTFILSVGWGLPLVPCLLYGLLRLTIEDSECWALPASDAWVEWIYMGPGLGCILANFVFFVNIFRILVTKLRAPHANEPAHFRKAVRATVVLLPLFGLHWLLTLYRPQSGHCVWLTFYKYVNVVLDGLQGLMVAIAFCYRNGEILTLLSRSLTNCRRRHEDGLHAFAAPLTTIQHPHPHPEVEPATKKTVLQIDNSAADGAEEEKLYQRDTK